MNIQIKTAILATMLLLSMGACKKDFITINPEGQFLTENYYTNTEQAYSGLIAVYDVLRKNVIVA